MQAGGWRVLASSLFFCGHSARILLLPKAVAFVRKCGLFLKRNRWTQLICNGNLLENAPPELKVERMG